jgi:hypothetical protein
MTRHFIQYHVVESGNPLSGEFGIRTKKPGDAKAGDVVWLLTAAPTSFGTRYAFVYWFVIDKKSQYDGLSVLSGEAGEWLSPEWGVSVSRDPWFAHLLQKTLGNGAFGFRPIPPELVPRFEDIQRNSGRSASVEDAESELDPSQNQGPEDERQQRAILTRRGQGLFREKLLTAYDCRCPVTESGVTSLLEAAHITPHAEGSDYRVTNGILLRADIHTLFDLHLLGIDAKLRVHLSREIKHSEYGRYDGKRIERLPSIPSEQPSPTALQQRFENFLLRERARTKQVNAGAPGSVGEGDSLRQAMDL